MSKSLMVSRRRVLGGAFAAAVAAPAVVRAQQWPTGPITWLNPFPAGVAPTCSLGRWRRRSVTRSASRS